MVEGRPGSEHETADHSGQEVEHSGNEAQVGTSGNDRDGEWRVRPATLDDLPFLQQMLYKAATWNASAPRSSLEQVLADPHVSRYIRDWGREGDVGVVAERPRGAPIGAAWARLFPSSEPGYGYIDSTIPEVTIAVLPELRGQGVGDDLLRAVIRAVRDAGFSKLSLSVEFSNRAVRLYERQGFVKIGTNGGAWTLVRDLTEA